jgi:predicted nuclease of predicted toxin-antitoxin system
VIGILLDENLPESLSLPTILPISHVSELGPSPTDSEIWAHAAATSKVIVTKDADFSLRAKSNPSPPPWVVHLRIGNLRLRELEQTVESLWRQVESHLPATKLINVCRDRIEFIS